MARHNGRIDKSEIQRIIESVPPSAVVQRHYALKGQGRYKLGIEHDSLVVDDERFSIFWNSRNWRGDALGWLREVEGMDFFEAVEWLRDFAGIAPMDRPVATAGINRGSVVERVPLYVAPERVAELVQNFEESPWAQSWLEEEKGIADFQAEAFRLGFCPNHTIEYVGRDGRPYTKSYGPTIAIPYFEPVTDRCLWIQHRLMAPPTDCKTRYVPERLDMGVWLYNAQEIGDKNKILVVEGAFKTITVSHAMLVLGYEDVAVVGVPNCTTFAVQWEKWIKSVTDVAICLDPPINALQQSWCKRLAEDKDSNRIVRVMSLFDKPDDLIRRPEGRGLEFLKAAYECTVRM